MVRIVVMNRMKKSLPQWHASVKGKSISSLVRQKCMTLSLAYIAWTMYLTSQLMPEPLNSHCLIPTRHANCSVWTWQSSTIVTQIHKVRKCFSPLQRFWQLLSDAVHLFSLPTNTIFRDVCLHILDCRHHLCMSHTPLARSALPACAWKCMLWLTNASSTTKCKRPTLHLFLLAQPPEHVHALRRAHPKERPI